MESSKSAEEEIQQFQNDLLKSVRQKKSSKTVRTTVVPPTANDSRTKVDLPKLELKDLQGIARNAQSKEHRDRSDRT